MLLFRLKNILKSCFWLLLTLMLMVGGRGVVKGQKIYATTAIPGPTNSNVTITNPNNAIGVSQNLPPAGTSPANVSATGTPGSTLGTGSTMTGYLELKFQNNVPANTYVFVKVANVTAGNLITGVTAEAYNGTTRDAGTTSSIITGGDGTTYFLLYGANSFDRVRITAKGAGGTILFGAGETASADVYYAYYNSTTVTDCGEVIGTGWVGSLGGSVANPQNAIDGKLNTFSTLGPGALLSYVDQTFYFAGLSNQSDEVKLTLSSPPAVLSASLLNNITISAYKGSSSTVLWSAGLGSVLSLDLLGLLGNGTPITISVAPNVQFDRVVVHFGSVLNLFSNLYIREIDRTSASPTFTTQNATICSNKTAVLTATTPPSGYENRWYDAAEGGTLVFTGNSFTTPSLTTTTTYYVARAKTNCPNESLRIPAIVTVNPLPVVNPISGLTTACVAAKTQLNNTTGGGSWSSSNTTVATVSATGEVTGVSAGTATITYTSAANANGCVGTATVIVTINPLPVVAGITGTTSICVNGNTTLSNTTVGGTWSSSNPSVATISSGGVVNGLTAGTTTISYTSATNANGCSGVATTTITVNPLPVVAAITGTNSVCVGKTTNLSTTTTGGVWSSNNGNATVSATGVVTGVTAGTAIITYTVTNGNGCVGTASATVTINPLPVVAAITGTTNVCIGNTTTLSTTTTGGVWSSNNGNATVSATGVVTGVTAGTAIITYTVTNGNGCVGTASATVTINPLPVVAAITGTTNVCIGNTTTLSTTTTSGVWSSNNGNATVSATGVVTGVTAGTAIITYTVTNGNGCVGTAAATVTINPLPTITLTSNIYSCQINATASLAYTATSNSPTSYSITWDSNSQSKGFVNVNNAVLPASPIIIAKPTGSALTPGTYHATLTVANATCTSTGIPITIEIKSTIPTPHVSLQ